MRRPTVLHVVRDWVRPSERFVSDVIGGCTATRAVVACGRRWADSPAAAATTRAIAVGPAAERLPAPLRQRGLRGLLAGVALTTDARVLYAHFGYWAPHAEAVARRLRLPWGVALHGHDLLVEARSDESLRCALRRASLVVVPSRFLAEVAVSAGIPEAVIRVIPAGLDLADLPFVTRRPADGGRVVVTFAGRFVEKKGVLDAAEALAAVARARPAVQVRFVGGGPLEEALRRRLAALALDAELVDGDPPGALRAALRATHVLVTPSRTAHDGDAETLGLVNLEAQACGVPVVTTRHGGIPEAVAPGGAVLVPEAQPTALADAVLELVDHPERWGPMGAAGRRHVAARYELGARVADLEEQLLTLAREGRPAPPPEDAPPARERPRVSVVMVTHDRRELAARALDALAAQTYPADRVEVVVVDNGTTDGTAAMLAERPAVSVIRSETNASTSWARTAAARAGSGEIVAFTDDDCRPQPTWLEALVAGFAPGVTIVQGRTVADPAQPLEPLSRTQWTPAEYGLYETANIAYRRDAFLAAGGFDEGFAAQVAAVLGPRWAHLPFGEDTDLAWRVKRAGGRSRFAVTAVVHHHVFLPDPGLLLRRAVVGAGFPALVRRIPELRTVFLWRRWFLGPRHAAALLAAGGLLAAAAGRRRGAVTALPYAWLLTRPTRRGRRARLRAAPVAAARDAVELGALAYGSARARTLVL